MNTRSFLKSLLVAAVAPSILLPKLNDSFKWKSLSTSGLMVPNPEWINAPFEIAFLIQDSPKGILFERSKEVLNFPVEMGYMEDPFPIRLNAKHDIVQPYIKI